MMSYQAGSDVGIQILLVARDGFRVEVVGLRIRAEDPDTLRYLPSPEHALPFRRVWIQAASPPPPRIDGCPWYEPFGQGRSVPEWLRSSQVAASSPYDGLLKLSRPSPDSVVLSQQLTLEFQRGRKVECARPDPGEPLGFPANGYPQPTDPVAADFYGEFELAWARPLSPGAWVALSFDRFDPDSLSTAFLMRVSDDWLFDPPQRLSPKAYAAG
ncbi:MAG TPA: hypothetical protein VGC06_00655 [Actinomycetes bacterium]